MEIPVTGSLLSVLVRTSQEDRTIPTGSASHPGSDVLSAVGNISNLCLRCKETVIWPVPTVHQLSSAAPTEEWRKTFEINVLGLSICTREAVQGMLQRGVNDGFIINISSTGGLRSPSTSSLCMYSASKHAVQVLTEGLRKDLADKKSGIRVTSICPGLVKTEIMDNLKILDKKRIYSKLSYLQPEHIADAVVYVLSQPAILEVPMLVIQHVGQGRIIESQ
ncbi:dehydrogenase/reductase SDR family member 11-like isoform X2 [Schistocerca nitens]|uniref:dehydrogenase/reductase SDR family member 11-like isoform X2 n=1 Tax=Schistocerca nitens TaxID=7011 RepID=UPI00211818A1|nr:dehydrogenase/reductase SDR family member 11-like isoform X2 [Schistocerca nitens]